MNQKRIISFGLFACSFLMWIGSVFYAVVAGEEDGLTVLWCVLGFLFSSVVAMIVHEIGHLCFGLLAKMKVLDFQIGSVRYDGKKLMLASSDVFGAVTMLPKGAQHLKRRYALMTGGGLIFSLLYLLLCALCLILGGAGYYVVGMGLPTAFYLFAFNAIPLSDETGDTDGKLLFDLAKNAPTATIALHVLTIQGLLTERAPSSIERSLYYDVPVVAEDDRNFLILLQLRYLYHLDLGETETALKIDMRMRELLCYLSEEDLEETYGMMLYDCCVLEDRREVALALYDRQRDVLIGKGTASAYRILAAYEIRWGSDKQAMEWIRLGKEALSDEIYGISLMEEKLLAFLESRLP